MRNIFSITRRRLFIGLVGLMAMTTILPTNAQKLSDFEDDYTFWGAPSFYLRYQAKVAYPLIDRMLKAYPPVQNPDQHRRMALVALDQFLHDDEYYRREAFYTFVDDRMISMLAELDQPVQSGVRVFKLYGGGFILKTRKTTVAIDFIPGGTTQKPFISDSVVFEVADRCDALLITASGSQYANRDIAKVFLALGKKVILPEGLWTNLEGDIEYVDTDEPVKTVGMTLYTLSDSQTGAQRNVCIMDFQGSGIVAHASAEDTDADWTWADRIHDQYNIDILLTKSRNADMETLLAGFQPRAVITSQENEMESTVDKRESYWATQKRLKKLADLNIPGVIMAWGEAYDYADTKSPNIVSTAAHKAVRNGILYIERNGNTYTPAGIKVN